MPKKNQSEATNGRGLHKTPKVLVADEEVTLCIPTNELPKGAMFSDYKEFFVQDLIIKKHVTLYKIARYKLPDGSYRSAPLPKNIEGSFGNGIKQYIVHQANVCNVSQVKIHQTLQDIGIKISEGQINNILLEEAKKLEPEYHAVAQVGIETAKEMRTDDTGHRHKGNNGVCTVIQNDLFAYFKSSKHKSRKNFLIALRVNHLDYAFTRESFEYVEKYKPKNDLLNKLKKMVGITCKDETEWQKTLELHNITKHKHRHRITESHR